MKRLLLAALSAAFALSMGIPTTYAQDGPAFRPVELWACSFRDGKDQEDMNDAYAYFTDGDAPYAGFQLNPYFAGNLTDNFDFIYLGVWESGSAMGADLASYLATGEEAAEAWNDTVDCSSAMYASTRIQAPQQTEDGNFMLAVSDCKVGKGISNGQAASAIGRFNAYRVANGMELGTILWYPVAGGGDADFDFKLLTTFTGAQQWGDYFSWYVDNEAYTVNDQIMEGIVSCDESRIYNGVTIMNNMM